MDCSLACRVCIRVGPYVVFTKNGRPEYHKDIKWIVDKDTVCWIDLMSDLDDEVIHSPQQELNVKFWDKNANRYEQVASDRSLLDAFDMYWEMSRLPLIVDVSDDTRNRTEPCLEQGNTEPQDVCTDIVLFTQQSQVGQSSMPCTKPKKGSTYKTVDAWGVNDEVEDVSVDDEKDNYKDLVSDDEELDPDYEPGSDEDVVDLAADDEQGCESIVHITDLGNPKIADNVTFKDGETFKRCIKQYAVLKEVELAVPYSQSTRYRAYCNAKRCKWRIHASRLQDGQTSQVCYCFIYVLH